MLGDNVATDTFQMRAFDETATACVAEPSGTEFDPNGDVALTGSERPRSLRLDGVAGGEIGADHRECERGGDEGEGRDVEWFEAEDGA